MTSVALQPVTAPPPLPPTPSASASHGELRWGTAEFYENIGGWGAKTTRNVWAIVAPPNVVMVAKRFFPRGRVHRSGAYYIEASDLVAYELVWFMQRYPLDMDDDVRAEILAAADRQANREESIAKILNGDYSHDGEVRIPSSETPRPYQEQAAAMIAAQKRLIVGDQLGLGKSLVGLLTLRNPDALPAVIVAQTHLTRQWERYARRIWPDLRVHIARKGTPYDMTPYGGPPDILILTYTKLAGWQHHITDSGIGSIIFDEVQDLRRGTSTDKGAAAAHVSRAARYSVGLTATPVYNYGDEVWNELDILAPGALGNRAEFLTEWAHSVRGKMMVKDPRALSLHLRTQGLIIARTRREVGRELPYGPAEKVPHFIEHDQQVLDRMTGDAVEMARLLLDRATDRQTRFTTAGEFSMIMRQATGLAKAPYVAAFVRTLLESEEKVILWGWHHAVFDLWQERLQRLGVYGVTRYTGHESLAAKERAVGHFVNGDARVLMMSLRSGAGLDGLQEACSTGVFGELDWSPKIHDQCAGRLARDGQTAEVLTYYMLSDGGADPKMAETLELKQAQAAPIEDPTAEVLRALPDGAGARVMDMARDLLASRGLLL